MVTWLARRPSHDAMNGPGPVGTDMAAHISAAGLVVSPYEAPTHTSKGESSACPSSESMRLKTATYPTAVSGGTCTEAHAFTSSSVSEYVDMLPSMMAEAEKSLVRAEAE